MKRGRRLAQTRRGIAARRWQRALFIYRDRYIMYPWVMRGGFAEYLEMIDLYEAMDDDEQDAREGGR